MISTEDLVAKIAEQSHQDSVKHKRGKPAAAQHLVDTMRLELLAALEAAGPEYRERVDQMLDGYGAEIDRSEDQTRVFAEA